MWHDTTTAMERLRTGLRAANPVPPSYDHLFDRDLLARLTSTDIVIDDSGEDAAVELVKRKRRPSVSSVIRQMKRAGVEVAGCEVQRDGTIRIIGGKPGETTPDNNDDDRNEWDTVQ